MDNFETSCDIVCHGRKYAVHVEVVNQDTLLINIEDIQLDEAQWYNEFSAKYIEEITKKTGNFKRFAIFVRMLLSALAQKSESVFVDLLTYADLELYRTRKNGQSVVSNSTNTALHDHQTINQKRYLILTYAVEFDRVHYPLPLNFLQTPSCECLQRTIRRLRQELRSRRDDQAPIGFSSHECNNLLEENRMLRAKLVLMEKRIPKTNDLASHNSQDVLNIERKNKQLQAAYEQLRLQSEKKIDRLEETIRSLQDRLHAETANQDRIHFLEKTLTKSQFEHREKLKNSPVHHHRSPSRNLAPPRLLKEKLHAPLVNNNVRSTSVDRPRRKLQPDNGRGTRARSESPSVSKHQGGIRLVNRYSYSSFGSDSSSYSGYSSTESDRSATKSRGHRATKPEATSTKDLSDRQSRPRTRNNSNVNRQRELDARLASPKHSMDRSSHRSSPSPMSIRSQSPRKLPPNVPLHQRRQPRREKQKNQPALSKVVDIRQTPAASSLVMAHDKDNTFESFTDIDSRLSALQQFLRDAKGTKTSIV